MPWKLNDKVEQRYKLVRQIMAGESSVRKLCEHFEVSRQTAYKWLGRYRHGRLRGLNDQSRKPLLAAGRTTVLWLRRVRAERLKRPTWGPRKLRDRLSRQFDAESVPATATISRWLKRWGLARGRRRRLAGPVILRKALHVPEACHEVWTVDFKGWYRTGDGQRVEPLTVRDLYSRFIFEILLLESISIKPTRQAFVEIFRKHGLPERIRCDNGTPFGGVGATGLTRLSAWWVKLGIVVEFITPGCPGENGAHEQMHRVYKAEVVNKPARTRRQQQLRTWRWVVDYNHQRGHEALKMKRPAELFTRNPRPWKKPEAWAYPAGWERRWVKGNGEITRDGIRRFVGEAFVRDFVGLKPKAAGRWEVYFGPMLVGELRENERGGIRMAKYAGNR